MLDLYEENGLAATPQVPADMEDVLEEAMRLTSGNRQNQYGPPDQDFARTAKMWTALFNGKLREAFTSTDVAMAMICLKLSRETHQAKRDNWVDIAGYARCGHICSKNLKAASPSGSAASPCARRAAGPSGSSQPRCEE